MSLFDHIGFSTKDLRRSLSFYESCMPKIGLAIIAPSDKGFFISGGERAPVPFLWVHQKISGSEKASEKPSTSNLHLMFTADSQEAVDAFHQAAIEGGGTESGAPAYQGAEVMKYYAALVFDPDGNMLEVGFRQKRR